MAIDRSILTILAIADFALSNADQWLRLVDRIAQRREEGTGLTDEDVQEIIAERHEAVDDFVRGDPPT